jgi:hypothetical protein
MHRRRVRSGSCRPADVVNDNAAAPEHVRDLTPDWSKRIRRAIISIGFVWLSIGAGVTTYYTLTGQTSDTTRGVLTMLLGAVTSAVGLLWARRVRRDHARKQTSRTERQAGSDGGHENNGEVP